MTAKTPAAAQKIAQGEASNMTRSYDPHTSSGSPLPGSLLAMIGALEVDAVRELELVLEARLAAPVETGGERREAELGFLASLLGLPEAMDPGSPRTTPRQSWYDEHRPSDAPSGRRLCRRYGSWAKACRAAEGLSHPGSGARPWAHARTGKRAAPRYTRDEVVRAVITCAAALGRMPSSHAYYTWAAERRRRAKETGAVARYPSQLTVEHHVGHWAEVTRAVEELLGGPSGGRARGGEGAVGG